MARKLKTFETSLGFYDLAIAAPSMKAALSAWGADSNLFHQGAAKESDDPDVVAATMAKPGVVLRRPVGSEGPFREHADLPTHLADEEPKRRPRKSGAKPKKRQPGPTDDKAARAAALAFEKEERRRENVRRKEEAAREKERARRQEAVAKAQAAFDEAKEERDERAAAIEAKREALEKKSQAEDARWEKQKEKLEAALRRARE
jgi:colicin import membrane protein